MYAESVCMHVVWMPLLMSTSYQGPVLITLLCSPSVRYRFAEIRYHRPEEVHKGRTLPARVETVVIFLPDVWSCNPSRLEWEQMAANFKKQLADKLLEENKEETTQALIDSYT